MKAEEIMKHGLGALAEELTEAVELAGSLQKAQARGRVLPLDDIEALKEILADALVQLGSVIAAEEILDEER